MAINLNELQELLTKAEINAISNKDICKGLTRLENLMTTSNQEVTNVYAILDGAAPVKKVRPVSVADADAPYGCKADGTPTKRPVRVKADYTA